MVGSEQAEQPDAQRDRHADSNVKGCCEGGDSTSFHRLAATRGFATARRWGRVLPGLARSEFAPLGAPRLARSA